MNAFPIDDYREQIESVRWGKRVYTHLYLHCSGFNKLPELLRSFIHEVETVLTNENGSYNVYKLGTRYPTVSLLAYPGFFSEALPGLSKNAVYNLQTGEFTFRDYAANEGQPILHRKELLLPPGDQNFSKFFSLTAAAEQTGLFATDQSIGNRGNWDQLLKQKGLSIKGHQLFDEHNQKIKLQEDHPRVNRYKTALKRNRLSMPIQKLFKHQLLNEETSLMDYGCGHGNDIQQLNEMGMTVNGWDPYLFVEGSKVKSDIVNLGYVLNVIDSVKERKDVLKASYALAEKVLIVSARLGTQTPNPGWKPYKDGYLTQRGTFQKYFEQEELNELIEQTLKRKPIPIGPGIFIIFNDDDAEVAYLTSRFRQRTTYRRTKVENYSELEGEVMSAADRFWEQCLELGRPCFEDEVADSEALFKEVGNHNKVFNLLMKAKDRSEFNAIKIKRAEDLIVEFALLQFQKTPFFKYLETDLKRDIQYHFGNYSTLKKLATDALFSIGDVNAIHQACREATTNDIGYLFGEHSLQLHVSLIDQLPLILRIYAGCGERLYGSLDGIDLVKLHIHSGKVTFIGFDDFMNDPIPNMIERIKINLWQQSIRFYDYVGPFTPVPLYLKSRFVSENFENFSKQHKFDQDLIKANIFNFENERLDRELVIDRLNNAGYLIDGFALKKVSN